MDIIKQQANAIHLKHYREFKSISRTNSFIFPSFIQSFNSITICFTLISKELEFTETVVLSKYFKSFPSYDFFGIIFQQFRSSLCGEGTISPKARLQKTTYFSYVFINFITFIHDLHLLTRIFNRRCIRKVKTFL